MPVNRNALIRYKTLDQCLQNRYRKWTLNDLIDACSDALYEYEGIDKGVSRRTVQADIQMMRSDKLGYNAPIVVQEKKYYTYEDPEYSITNIPLTGQDLDQLGEAISFLKQFRGFSHFQKLEGMVQKLEDHIYSKQENRPAIIDFEKNDLLKGIHFLESIYQAILKEKILAVEYQSFRAKSAQAFFFYPYLLKEYNNRWFVLGKKEKQGNIMNLALDRIVELEILDKHYKKSQNFDANEYFKNVVGVTVSETQELQKIRLMVYWSSAPYLLTKPLHHSQKEIERTNEGVIVSLELQLNYELERAILGYGESIKVIQPLRLRRRIQKRMQEGLDNYTTDLSGKGLIAIKRKFQARAMSRLDHLYTQRAFNQIKWWIEKEVLPIFPEKDAFFYMPDFVKNYAQLANILFKSNLKKLIKSIDEAIEFKYARLVRMNNLKKEAGSWHQQTRLYYPERNKDKAYKNWKNAGKGFEAIAPSKVLDNTVVIQLFLNHSNERTGQWQFLLGSHRKVFGQKEIELLSENSIGQVQDIQAGNVLVLRPLILRKFEKGPSTKKLYMLELIYG